MSLKSIVAVASGDREDVRVVGAAAKLAARFAGHVRVVPAFPSPAADFVSYGTALRAAPEAAERIAESEREAQEQLEAIAKEAAAAEGLTADPRGDAPSMIVERRALLPVSALAPAAALADLVLFSAAAGQSSPLAGLFAETLLSTRAPVLLVKEAPALDRPIALAWDGSAQAARAARAALPLLRAAPGVVVLRNVDDGRGEAHADALANLETYLMQQGVTKIVARELHGNDVAASLLEGARADKCWLIVAGGYGRPRMFQMVLGGTTQALVTAAGGPDVLLAH